MAQKRVWALAIAGIASLSLLGGPQAIAGNFRYETLSIPKQKYTIATGISDRDQVVGYFAYSHSEYHGFVWDKGAYTQVDGPEDLGTQLIGINARGIVAGSYMAPSGYEVAFTYNIATGQQQVLQTNPRYWFFANSINLVGDIVGLAQAVKKGGNYGFIGKANGRKVKLLNFPGDTSNPEAIGINDSGTVVGSYVDASEVFHGYIYQSGAYTSFDPPGSTQTRPFFITDDGVVGGWFDQGGVGYSLGFTMQDGAFSIFNYPGSQNNTVVGIGPDGEVVGNWTDSGGIYHGFIDRGGTYYNIDVPGKSGTEISAVNAKGSLVGIYRLPHRRAFIAKCAANQRPCTQ